MKAKYIHETLGFNEDSDPVEDMGIGNEAIFQDLKRRGIRMEFVSYLSKDGPQNKEELIKNIREVEKLVNKLVEVGFDIKKMKLSWSSRILVNTYAAVTPVGYFHCATEEDAQIILNTVKKFSMWDNNVFDIREESTWVYMDPDRRQWLDNLIENRKKYKNIK